MKHLVLGGARSGKSKFAESWAQARRKNKIYIATGQAFDEEMSHRIEHHKKQRGDGWTLVEEPIALADVARAHDTSHHVILVDCLTLWVSNCMHAGHVEQEKHNLLTLIPHLSADLILVSNEVGSGVIPLGPLTRDFVDHSGWLHQSLAQLCDQVTLVVAGLPLTLKDPASTPS